MNKYISSEKTNRNRNCTYWVREDGREFITDPNAEILNLSRLTAYAEYGTEIYESHAHHELPILKIDAPAFLDVLPPEKHGELHRRDSASTDVDGFTLIRADQ